jgi:hypothetical protein
MIKKVELKNFKQFKDTQIQLHPAKLSIVVGGNNSGKSSLLQALAVWNFAKSIIIFSKGAGALTQGSKKDGVGISIDDFTPVNIPSFEYLWTNLKSFGSYILRIKLYWDDEMNNEKFLEIGFSLTQDRLYVKNTSSNLSEDDSIPEIAYLPPFAGITEKEPWRTVADRRKQIGLGLSGSVLRNLIYDYYFDYLEKGNPENFLHYPRKLRKQKTTEALNETVFGKLNNILAEVFYKKLFPENFSREFHNYLKVPLKMGAWVNGGHFEPLKQYSSRDIMAEGRGFLQWLSTFCLLFDSKINILLLDEPDAHLHATLQVELIKYLELFSGGTQKQILVATHSSEVIKSVSPYSVLEVRNVNSSYCMTDSQVKTILLGLGVQHFPLLHKIQKGKKIIFVEAGFDERIIKKLAEKLERPINADVVFWPMASTHKDRKQVFLHLKNEINGIKVISLSDKDDFLYSQTRRSLTDDSCPDVSEVINKVENKFLSKRWRRWELENYLINPKAIAEIANKAEDDIISDMVNEFSMVWPVDYKSSDRSNSNASLFDREGKTIVEWFANHYKFRKDEIPQYFEKDDIPEDIITLINVIHEL